MRPSISTSQRFALLRAPAKPGLALAILLLAGCGNLSSWQIDPPPQEPDPDQPFSGPQPQFGPTVTSPTPPPPLTGGTLLVLQSGVAVAADPDRDRVYAVDVAGQAKIADIALQPGDQPGRIVEDGAGRVHVVLRGSGAVATIDPTTWTATRQAVCAAPRGIAYDANADLVHVACAGGELVSLPAAGGAPTRTVQLERDLRDVLVIANGSILLVTKFRSAEVLSIDSTGAIATRWSPTQVNGFANDAAWRMVAAGGALYMLHQRAKTTTIDTQTHGGYGSTGPCEDSIVHTAISPIYPNTAPLGSPRLSAPVPIDLAASSDGRFAVVAAGNTRIPFVASVMTFDMASISSGTGDDCDGSTDMVITNDPPDIEPIAVAYTADSRLIVQSREPAELIFVNSGAPVMLSADSRADTGHAIFHANAGGGIACASCHLEGGDDARAWPLDIGTRRTQSLHGGVLGTEPFHWDGEQPDLVHLFDDVFVKRMSGPLLLSDQIAALGAWINTIPTVPHSPGDAAAIARGAALFNDATNVGCVTCHAGPQLTNNLSLDVGTGAKFQVPSLRDVADRAPYLHDGRAATLVDRFTVGGGDMHGHTSQLTPAQIGDLVAYLDSL